MKLILTGNASHQLDKCIEHHVLFIYLFFSRKIEQMMILRRIQLAADKQVENGIKSKQ